MNIEEVIKELKSEVNDSKECRYIDLVGDECVEFFQLIETLLTAYEKEKEKNKSLEQENSFLKMMYRGTNEFKAIEKLAKEE